MKWKCSKCGQVVTSPPLNNNCPKGGNHSWTSAQYQEVSHLLIENLQ
ncbi:hypothetical protein [uncultured Kordia sp.]|nr:hypothetical protein [uncultured Kordia sp.]